MNYTLLDHPYFSELLGDREVYRILSAEYDIQTLLKIERALSETEASLNIIPEEAAKCIARVCESWMPNMEELKTTTRQDGVVMPGLVKQLRREIGEPYAAYVHLGATSQDIVDTSLMIRSREIIDIFVSRLKQTERILRTGQNHFGERSLAGITRMRKAIPMKVQDRTRNWIDPIRQLIEDSSRIKGRLGYLQFSGAVGTLDKLPGTGSQVRRCLAERLNLLDPEGPWHVDRLRLGELGNWLSSITAFLGKIGTDLTMMVLDEISTVKLKGGGKSSTMPHKQNPVDAEILISFARYNAIQLAGLHSAMVHENERSGAMWTLEWMILPQMLITTGCALNTAIRLADNIERIGNA